MKKYCLLFIFVFSTGLLFSQFTKTVTQKNRYTEIITKTSDKSLNTIYTIEYVNNEGIVMTKAILKKDLLNRWEITKLQRNEDNKTQFNIKTKSYYNSKLEVVKWERYNEKTGKLRYIYTIEKSTGDLVGTLPNGKPIPPEDLVDNRIIKKYITDPVVIRHRKHRLDWYENLKEDTPPPPFPLYNDAALELQKEKKECEEKKVSLHIGPSLLNGDFGTDKESFFGGQVYASYNITANLSLGTDISMHSKKDGDSKYTRSLILARGQYDFFTGDNCDKTVIPEAHVVIGLGSESVKFTFDGDTSKFSASGLSYGVGAGVGIQVSTKVKIGLSVDYVGIKFKDSDSVNSNIRAGAGIKIGFGSGSSNNKKSLLRNESSDPIFW